MSEGVRFALSPTGAWPTCLYEPGLRCGAPETRAVQAGPSDALLVERGWHTADMCDCPSCPLRVAIRSALAVLGE